MKFEEPKITRDDELEISDGVFQKAFDRMLRLERETGFMAACEAFGHTNEVENYRKFLESERK
jgi:hypothetical protein